MKGTIRRSKNSISNARSYAEIGKFWDEHDLGNFWGKTRKVKFDVGLKRRSPKESGVEQRGLVFES